MAFSNAVDKPLKPGMGAPQKTVSNANVKRIPFYTLILLFLMGCNMPRKNPPAFLPPSSAEETNIPIDLLTTPTLIIAFQDNPSTPSPEDTSSNSTNQTPLPTNGGIGGAGDISPTTTPINSGPLLYYTQAGDTLPVLAVRFGVQPEEITSPDLIPETSFINPNQLLIIPNRLSNTTSPLHLLPDSELVYSPSAMDFDANSFIEEAGGYLSEYHEYLGSTGESKGAQVLEMVALDNSINPRLLIALLEYQSSWVYGQPENFAKRDYPMGYIEFSQKDLLRQLKWAVNQLSIGYYDWREGRLTEIHFSDGAVARLSPELNAGTAALQYFFAQLYDSQGWIQVLDPDNGFPALYAEMFGNPWLRAQTVEPLFPPDLTQPELALPFLIGPIWSYTGGPHGAWERDGSWAAVDFAPASTQSGCVESTSLVTASAPGLVVRSDRNIVVLDLDGDGNEQTGWAIIYLHIANKNRIPAGTWVETGDFLGYPSCEGGRATGTHTHIARKFNGEWMTADGPIPFVLSGWRVHAGLQPYKGTLTRGDQVVVASQVGAFTSRISRDQ
jgi:hypothetical protein